VTQGVSPCDVDAVHAAVGAHQAQCPLIRRWLESSWCGVFDSSGSTPRFEAIASARFALTPGCGLRMCSAQGVSACVYAGIRAAKAHRWHPSPRRSGLCRTARGARTGACLQARRCQRQLSWLWGEQVRKAARRGGLPPRAYPTQPREAGGRGRVEPWEPANRPGLPLEPPGSRGWTG